MEITAENKMGTAPVWSLLLTMALPVILSTAAQSLYNIVDGIFVSMLGEDAMAAITFAGPCTKVLIALGTGIAVGMNTMLSHGLGEKSQKQVDDAAATAIFLSVVGGVLSLLAAFTLVRPYLSAQTDSSAILEGGTSYLMVYLGLGIGTIGQLVFERMLIATGKTVYSMISQATGAILNLILDPLLIFTAGMGITGAALATVIGQIAAMLVAMSLNFAKNKEVHIRFSLTPPVYAVKRVLVLGLPSTLLLSLDGIMIVNFNAVLNKFSSTAVATFGACARVTGFFYAVVNALCSAAAPIIAYNHGAKNGRRINQAIKFGYLYAMGLMAVGLVLCAGFPEMFLRMFSATDEMVAIGIWGMRALSCCYLLVAVRNMSTVIIQSLGHSFTSMAVDLSRNYAVLIPMAWLLSLTGKLNAVWLSVPVADTVSAVVGFTLMLHFYRKDIKIAIGERTDNSGSTGVYSPCAGLN